MKHSSCHAATFMKDSIAAEQKVMVGAHIMMCTLQATEKAVATKKNLALTAITSELDLMIYNGSSRTVSICSVIALAL